MLNIFRRRITHGALVSYYFAPLISPGIGNAVFESNAPPLIFKTPNMGGNLVAQPPNPIEPAMVFQTAVSPVGNQANLMGYPVNQWHNQPLMTGDNTVPF